MTTHPQRLVSLWDMLRDFFPIHQLAMRLRALRGRGSVLDKYLSKSDVLSSESEEFREVLEAIRDCSGQGLIFSAEMAARLLGKSPPETYRDMFVHVEHLSDLLDSELGRVSVFCIPPERVVFYEQSDLFGKEVAAAFPSCERDIREAGSCYALERADACVHHLMLVLERGLHALSGKVGVVLDGANWQFIIDQIATQLKGMPRGPDLDFYRAVKAQFGFLKDAYRNHSEHVHEPYDLPRAFSTLDHVGRFMRELAKGGLSE